MSVPGRMPVSLGLGIDLLCLDEQQRIQDSRLILDPAQARPPVEVFVERQDGCQPLRFHHGDVDGVARRQLHWHDGDLRRSHNMGLLHGKNLIDQVQHQLKGRSDRLASLNRYISVDDFLECFGVSDKALTGGNQPLDQNSSLSLVWMVGSDQIHQNIGIDERQAR